MGEVLYVLIKNIVEQRALHYIRVLQLRLKEQIAKLESNPQTSTTDAAS
jgi:hypothetical protein